VMVEEMFRLVQKINAEGLAVLLVEQNVVQSLEVATRTYVLEHPIRADYALISARAADRWGNLVYRETARNFGPIMAAAATTTIVQVDEIVPLGSIDPETVVTPGLYVDRVVAVGERRWLKDGVFVGGTDLEGRPLEKEEQR